MKNTAQVVVIGGGVVGASVLYHLTKAGWTDVVLVERTELTAGSTWHSAGGMHTLNGDPNVAKLQQYTIELYKQIEEISGQDCSIHITGGVMLADTPERMDWLRMSHARGRYLGMETELISVAEAKRVRKSSVRNPKTISTTPAPSGTLPVVRPLFRAPSAFSRNIGSFVRIASNW